MPERAYRSRTPDHSSTVSSADLSPTGPVATRFQQPCPACGRRLLILLEYLGKEVHCSHCRRGFVARGLPEDHGDGAEDSSSILKRAERLLAAVERSRRTRGMCKV